ncbi:MAG: hypothetical protein ACI4JC_02050 [Faecalibacterium sp.]
MTAAIKAVQEWLKACPLVAQQLGENVSFYIDYLPDRTAQFSIEDSPGAPVLKSYFDKTLRAKNYVLASRMVYSEDIAQQAANSAFWDAFADWIERQSAARRFPELGPGRRAKAVEVTTSGYILASEEGACRFQIQIQLQYFQLKGAAQ